MSDEARPARKRRLQVHLSTAVVMMVVAGGMIWVNTIPRYGLGGGRITAVGAVKKESLTPEEYRILREIADDTEPATVEYGWPGIISRRTHFTYSFTAGPPSELFATRQVFAFGIFFNLAVILSVLFVIWYVCESWIGWYPTRMET